MTSIRIRGAAVASLVVLSLLTLLPAAAQTAQSAGGVRPVGRDGRVLNLDFETGTLADWTAEGDAFNRQPVKGDTVSKRRGDMKSHHQGVYWIGGYEVMGDDAVGTLTSAPFKVTHRWASFRIAGGPWRETRVELVRASDHLTHYTFSGYENETLRPVVVDMSRHEGQEFYVKLIDERKGHWGHINFDNFQFHAARPKFADELDLKKATPPPPADVVKFDGLSPQEAVKAITLPQGFKATLVAAEPDVRQPVAFTIDARGRLWVLECLTYPLRAPDGQGKDNIVIFEDTDNDGDADKRTVFAQGLNLATGIEVGFGGVWVGAAPHLLFIPDRNGDDKPDSEPQVLLDGWGYQDTHETLNTFTWGPDGWLYGCHGVFTHSIVGKPGASAAERTKINAGIWRYHPTQHKFEVFAEGTSNPWGFDFDRHGQLWAEACVIPHLWHIIQGARYQRQGGVHFNPYTFDDIKQHADHVHYAGNQGPHAGNNRSDAAGGGHAHAGLMVYQGNNWPAQYRDKIYIGNIHGQRVNVDIPEPRGSGFVGKHGPDFLNFNDKWSQVVNFRMGPDGGVYFIDWYDRQQCHTPNFNAHDRSNGRIFKVVYGDKVAPPNDLAALDNAALAALVTKLDNETVNRTARRLLQERHANQPVDESVRRSLVAALGGNSNDAQCLRALWALHVTGGVPEALALEQLRRTDRPYTTAWTIQLLAEKADVSPEALAEINRLAKQSPAAVVRLYVASAMTRLPLAKRWEAMEGLLARSEDAADHNLPLLYWYGFEPLAAVDPGRAMSMALGTKIPNILTFTVRRIGALEGDAPLVALTAALGGVDEPNKQAAILRGINESLRGRRTVSMPRGWEAVEAKLFDSRDEAVRSQVRSLGVTFGSGKALAAMKQTLADSSVPVGERQAALDALLNAKVPDLAPALQSLLKDERLRGPAIRGLAAYGDPSSAKAILDAYPSLDAQSKKDALGTLSSRAESGKALLAAVASGNAGITAKDISADIVRQLRNLNDPEIDKQVAKVWGVVQQSSEDKLKRMEALRAIVTANRPGLAAPNPSHGRALYVKTCAQCHRLFDETGGQVGPDITGANRSDLAYILENVVDPNAVIPIDYQASILDTKDGRTVVGIVKKQDDTAVTIVTNTETLVIPRNEVKTLRVSKLSMMPEGLLDTFGEQEVRDLVAYLRSPSQVPLAASAEQARNFFNGKDLAGWVGRSDVFTVQNGEIVGKTTTGLKNNEFLRNEMELGDFRLVLKVKLVPNTENSGIQFRSVPVPNSPEMKGYQADVGQGWWGKLYHESGRGLLWKEGADDVVKKEDWNTYEILAVGHKIQTALNGKKCVDLDDPEGELKGHIAVQVHSGGPMEVRFKDFELEVNPEPKLKTVK